MTDWQVPFQWKLVQFQLCICSVFTGCMTVLSGWQHQSHLTTSLLGSLPNNLSSNNLNITYSHSKMVIYKGLRDWWLVQAFGARHFHCKSRGWEWRIWQLYLFRSVLQFHCYSSGRYSAEVSEKAQFACWKDPICKFMRRFLLKWHG